LKTAAVHLVFLMSIYSIPILFGSCFLSSVLTGRRVRDPPNPICALFIPSEHAPLFSYFDFLLDAWRLLFLFYCRIWRILACLDSCTEPQTPPPHRSTVRRLSGGSVFLASLSPLISTDFDRQQCTRNNLPSLCALFSIS